MPTVGSPQATRRGEVRDDPDYSGVCTGSVTIKLGSFSCGGRAIDLGEVLVCPTCHGEVEWRAREVLCPACQARYPIIDGIPFMLAGEEGVQGREGYDAIAHIYDEALPLHVTEHYLNKRVGFISQYVKGGPILDVGCGTGRLARRLLAEGYPVIGADASLGMLRVFQARTACTPVGAPANALPFRSEAFRGVVCIALLHHIAHPEKVRASLGEMYRVTGRGGVLILWDHNPANPYWPIIMRKVPQDFGQERLIPLSEIRQGLLQAGAASLEVFRMGFVPDFVPAALLPFMQWVEKVLEGLPLVRRLAAHNVVVVRKG